MIDIIVYYKKTVVNILPNRYLDYRVLSIVKTVSSI